MKLMIHSIWTFILYRPIINTLAFLISIIHNGDAGVAIILLTIIVKIILYPISKKGIDSQIKAMEMQAKMNKIAPELEKIKKSGASREEQARLTLELHKKHDIDTFAALSGCLVQIPMFIVIIALYSAFRTGINFDNGILYSFIHAPEHINMIFLGLIDISKKSLILAVLAGISQYFMVQYMPKAPTPVVGSNSFQDNLTKNMNMQMKYVFPLFVGFIAYIVSGAVALYYITNNLFTTAQQIYEGRKRNMLAIQKSLNDK